MIEATFDKPDDFKFEQFEYPEPVSLKLSLPSELKKRSALHFEACSVKKDGGSWSSCAANGWARIDKKSNRVFIDIDSIALSYESYYEGTERNLSLEELNASGKRPGIFAPKRATVYKPIFSDVGFSVKGVVCDLSIEEGIAVDGSNKWGITADTNMVIQFEDIEQRESKREVA